MLAAVPRPPLGSNEGKSAGSAHVVISRVDFTPNVARPAGGVKGRGVCRGVCAVVNPLVIKGSG